MNAIASFGFYYIITPYVIKKSFDEFMSYLSNMYKSNTEYEKQHVEIVKLRAEVENIKSYIKSSRSDIYYHSEIQSIPTNPSAPPGPVFF